MELKDKLRRWIAAVALLYAVLVGPLLIVMPILQAMRQWHVWEIVAWLVAVVLAGAIALGKRGRR